MDGGGGSQSQPSQFDQQESFYDVVDDMMQALETSFGSLSFAHSGVVRQNGNPVHHNRYNQVINRRSGASGSGGGGSGGGGSGGGGSGGGGSGGVYMYPRNVFDDLHELDEILGINQMQQRQSLQNNWVNGSYVCDTNGYGYGMPNNCFYDAVSYTSRNHVSDQNPWYHSNGVWSGFDNPWSGYEGFGYNHDRMMRNHMRLTTLSMAKDQKLRRYVQMDIVQGSKETVDMIFNDLIDHICDLMKDTYGHDVVMTLLKKCSSEQITIIANIVTHNQSQFVNICFDQLGSKAIQLLLEKIKIHCEEGQVLRIVAAIRMAALQLSTNINAKFVIVKCFSEFTYSQCKYLLDIVTRNCYQIAIVQQGCFMLQKCLNIQSPVINHCLFKEIINHALILSSHCFGNYLVQFLVELDDVLVTKVLVSKLEGSYANLARNKFGSHVVQKLLELKYIKYSRLIVKDLLTEIDTLLLDPFGNYVIQTAWTESEDHQVRDMLRLHIQRNIQLMRCNQFGNKILKKLNL